MNDERARFMLLFFTSRAVLAGIFTAVCVIILLQPGAVPQSLALTACAMIGVTCVVLDLAAVLTYKIEKGKTTVSSPVLDHQPGCSCSQCSEYREERRRQAGASPAEPAK